jgi:hypothetical protein
VAGGAVGAGGSVGALVGRTADAVGSLVGRAADAVGAPAVASGGVGGTTLAGGGVGAAMAVGGGAALNAPSNRSCSCQPNATPASSVSKISGTLVLRAEAMRSRSSFI